MTHIPNGTLLPRTGAIAHIVRCGGAIVALTAASPSQYGWIPQSPGSAASGAITYDPVNGQLLAVGSHVPNTGQSVGTFLWDGEHWTTPALSLQPPARGLFAMTTDLLRRRVVLFGGNGVTTPFLNDTWEWDGTRWQSRTGAAPPPRVRHAMAYDALRGVTVLFGGQTSGIQYSDTWEWDGTSWLQRVPLVAPPARFSHAMAYDMFRARVVMHGGEGGGPTLGDTWEWDGQRWVLSPVNLPGRYGHTLSFDPIRGVTLMFGGLGGPAPFMAWDGTSWQQVAGPADQQPAPRYDAAMAFDWSRSRTVLCGGSDTIGYCTNTREWDGATWTSSNPGHRFDTNMVFDPVARQTILFGGTSGSLVGPYVLHDDTWSLRNDTWRQLQPPHRPSPRGGAGFAFDEARGNAILFGGGGALADTWSWTGADWVQLQPAVSPSGRFLPAMVYDAAHQEIVLFGGGFSPTAVLQDTWIWNGSTWTRRLPAHSPGARRSAAIAFDGARQNVVMFGGTGTNVLNDTWIWNGTDWTAGTPHLIGRSDASMTYDPARGRVLLMFGVNSSAYLNSVSEWTGTAWVDLSTPGPTLVAAATTFDRERGRIIAFGGHNGRFMSDAQWDYGYANPAAAEAFGIGCPGIAGTPTLTALSLPWIGIAMAMSATPVPAGATSQLAVGFSNTTDHGTPLPLALDTIGMPGCAQHVSIDRWVPATISGASANAFLAIPNSASLVGLRFYCQSLVADPAANALGFVTSNALACRVGKL